jgi:hypothetical protein
MPPLSMSRAQWGGLAEVLLTKKTTPGRELLTALAGRSACAASANRRWKRSVAACAGWLREGTPVIEMGYSPTEFWGVSTGFEADRVSLSDFFATCGDPRPGQAASLRKAFGKCSSRSRTAVLITA